MLAWEQDRLDHAVTDAFGYHALQLGLPELDGLRANRMPHRWIASDSLVVPEPLPMPPPSDSAISTMAVDAPLALLCEFDALPFPSDSVDLVVLPHALELARDPHETLREVERVLVPEGRVVIVGFNPASLWGVRQRLGHLRGAEAPNFLPRAGEFIGYWRVRDWLRLLGLEIDGGRFGCWRPPMASERWLQRFAWMDRTGERWWPVLGAVYVVTAVKRVRGMRLVGLARAAARPAVAGAPAAVAQRDARRIGVAARQRDAETTS
jgi:SAM-dependent methyltransferase